MATWLRLMYRKVGRKVNRQRQETRSAAAWVQSFVVDEATKTSWRASVTSAVEVCRLSSYKNKNMDLSKVKTGQIRCNFTDGVHFAYMATQAGVASYRNATPPLTLQLCIQALKGGTTFAVGLEIPILIGEKEKGEFK
uniref:Uncharacterized protein n=1 Tax=Oryza sativa subsp. japonica TaxID=39947 RepID=Q6K212_ORYSJ|nr:hypothetical protein [Oryza sativa Japonica Group]